MSRLEQRRRRRRRRRNMGLLWLAQFVNTAGLMMLVPVMPLYMERLDVPDGQVGLWAGIAIAAPALPLAVVTPLWGRLGDRIGHRWMVVRSLAGLSAAMALMAAAPTAVTFVAGRLLQGTVGGVVEAAAAYVGADDEDEGRGSRLGKSFGATAAGALVGPVAGGLLVDGAGLTRLMVGIAVLAAILAVCCAALLRENRDPVSLAAGASSRAVGIARSIGPAVLVSAFLLYFALYGILPVFPDRVDELVPDESVGVWVGVLHAVMWSGTLLASPAWGRRNDRTGQPLRTVMWAGSIAGCSVLAQAVAPHVVLLLPLRLAQGVCFAAIAQSIFLHASRRASAADRAAFVGTANRYLLIGQFAGPLSAGAALAVLPAQPALIVAGAIVVVAGVLGLHSSRGPGPVMGSGRHRAGPAGGGRTLITAAER